MSCRIIHFQILSILAVSRTGKYVDSSLSYNLIKVLILMIPLLVGLVTPVVTVVAVSVV